MKRIDSALDTRSTEFQANRQHNLGLAQTLRDQQAAVRHERPARDMERLARQNKLFVRDRLQRLLDPQTVDTARLRRTVTDHWRHALRIP